MRTVRSSDGTLIAFECAGSGPPLVLVHGGVSDHTRWRPVFDAFIAHFTVYAMDRRGRGESGDGADYDLTREYEDVAAVVQEAGPETRLLGHSFGALCALEAALLVDNLSHLVVYEPPFSPDGAPIFDPGTFLRLRELLKIGDREGVLTTFYREIVHLPDDAVAQMRTDDAWTGRVAAAHTIVREGAIADYVYDPARFSGLTVPTLLLTGELSPPSMSGATLRLADDLPNNRLVEIAGQGHVAIDTAPDLFLELTIDFLTS